MKYRNLGRTDLSVSEISLGTWAFGNNVYGGVTEHDAIKTIHSAVDKGINFYDTAPQYGTQKQDGVAEIVLGKALKSKRKDIIISSKFGRNPTIENGASQFYKTRVVSSVEESLKRLKTDYIDILFFHSPFSPNEISDDVWEGLEQVRKQGKVRYVGHSISKLKETEDLSLNWSNNKKIDVVQLVLSLMNREAINLINRLSSMNIGIVARECLANGFLAGTFNDKTTFPEGSLNARYTAEELKSRITQVNKFKSFIRKDSTMVQTALRWVLDQKGISTVLSGAKNEKELVEAVGSSNIESFDTLELNKALKILQHNFEAA